MAKGRQDRRLQRGQIAGNAGLGLPSCPQRQKMYHQTWMLPDILQACLLGRVPLICRASLVLLWLELGFTGLGRPLQAHRTWEGKLTRPVVGKRGSKAHVGGPCATGAELPTKPWRGWGAQGSALNGSLGGFRVGSCQLQHRPDWHVGSEHPSLQSSVQAFSDSCASHTWPPQTPRNAETAPLPARNTDLVTHPVARERGQGPQSPVGAWPHRHRLLSQAPGWGLKFGIQLSRPGAWLRRGGGSCTHTLK